MSNACLHRIVIEPTTIRGDQGQYYRVRYEDEVLIEETWNPELEACRALIARGITGRMEVWRAGKAHADIIVPSIEEAARWSVVENDKERALSLSYGSRCPRTFSEMPFPAVGGFRQRLILCLGYPVTHPPRPRPKNSPHRQISRRQPLPREIAMPKGIPIPIAHLPKREQPLCGARTRRCTDIANGVPSTMVGAAITAAYQPVPRRQEVAGASAKRSVGAGQSGKLWCQNQFSCSAIRSGACAHHGLLLDGLNDFAK